MRYKTNLYILGRFISLMDKVTLGQVVFPPEYFSFPLSVSFHQCSTFIFIFTLLIPDGQTLEVWEPSKKQCSFRNLEVLDTTALSLFFILQGIKNQSANYTLLPDTSTTLMWVSSSKTLLIKIPNA